MASVELIQAVAVTAELCGRVFSEPAAAMFVADLEGFDERSVIKALSRCRKEVRGVLTVVDVINRLDDGRPGAEEAWAQVPMTDLQSVVWTEEMAEAFGIATPLIEDGDMVAARMAFKEAYLRLLAKARDERKPVKWTPSLGEDKSGAAQVLTQAVAAGRLSYEHAQEVMPSLPAPANAQTARIAHELKKIGAPA